MNASATVNVILTCHAARTQGQTTRSVFLTKTTCFRKRNPISPLVAGRKCTIKTKATFFICHSPPLFLFLFLRRQLIKASHEKIELSTHESKSWKNWYYLNIARYLLKQKFLWVKERRYIKHCTGMSVCKLHKMYGEEIPYLFWACLHVENEKFLAECLVEMSKQRRETDGLSMLANPYLYAKQNWIQMINATTCVICNFV